ncbi:MAG: DNA mismatch repair protein MutS [Acidobacteria bacterium]|nr:DNA mismatch repair protein MutS [Acidobacteriota bacterium]
MSPEPSTPLMRQYHAVKQQVPGALLLFRLGDFYELFFEDAVTAARELEITLTSRNKEKGVAIPMCGVPYHSAESYVARLIQKGYRVAICDQMEAPQAAKKLVRRELTRILTPGTVTNGLALRSGENNYLAAAVRLAKRAGLAWVDVSTGEFRAAEIGPEELAAALEQLGPREVLATAGEEISGAFLKTEIEEWILDPARAERSLSDHFGVLSLDGCGLSNRPAAIAAAGAILDYLRQTQRTALEHLDRPAYYDRAGVLSLDAPTVRNLELVEPIFAGEGATLLGLIDQTSTAPGARLLRQRLLAPSLELDEIEARLEAVGELAAETIVRSELRKQMSGIQDLERLLARIAVGTGGPREVLALGKSLAKIAGLRGLAENLRAAPLGAIARRLDELPELAARILAAISDAPPPDIAQGGAIRPGFDVSLDELRGLSQNSRAHIAAIEARERARSGIQSLKVRFNNVFGFYIEITKANLHLAPADYERKQTLVNAERFTTAELKEYERKVLEAEEHILALERELFAGICRQVASEAQRIRSTAAALAELDVAAALAETAAENRWTRPVFSADGAMEIRAGRHPVIERLCAAEGARFIPNDLYLDARDPIAIVTGPNMGGKSTYLRQAALISILAQMGSFVPAEAARLPLTDRIFTRIGASDNLARGRSTFMVEMTETAVILNTATARSLIVLDEVGRGTATYDGLALAWAVVEHIHARTRARTLFATHYHELTELAAELEGVRNLRVAVKESGEKIIFLRKVEPGKADRSYGIEVARLAGLPLSVIERAREVLRQHEQSEQRASARVFEPVQIRLFEPLDHGIAARIRELKLDELRPIEALQLLSELQQRLKNQQ